MRASRAARCALFPTPAMKMSTAPDQPAGPGGPYSSPTKIAYEFAIALGRSPSRPGCSHRSGLALLVFSVSFPSQLLPHWWLPAPPSGPAPSRAPWASAPALCVSSGCLAPYVPLPSGLLSPMLPSHPLLPASCVQSYTALRHASFWAAVPQPLCPSAVSGAPTDFASCAEYWARPAPPAGLDHLPPCHAGHSLGSGSFSGVVVAPPREGLVCLLFRGLGALAGWRQTRGLGIRRCRCSLGLRHCVLACCSALAARLLCGPILSCLARKARPPGSRWRLLWRPPCIAPLGAAVHRFAPVHLD